MLSELQMPLFLCVWRRTFLPLGFILCEILKLCRNRARTWAWQKAISKKREILEKSENWAEVNMLYTREKIIWKKKNHSHEKKWISESKSNRDMPGGSLHEIKPLTSSQFCLSDFRYYREEEYGRHCTRLRTRTLRVRGSKGFKIKTEGKFVYCYVACWLTFNFLFSFKGSQFPLIQSRNNRVSIKNQLWRWLDDKKR